jgi:hypothetical protein
MLKLYQCTAWFSIDGYICIVHYFQVKSAEMERRGCIFSGWVFVGILTFALLLFGVTMGLLWWTRQESPAISIGTAALNIIPAPTSTSLPTVPPLPSPTPTPATDGLSIGSYVKISGTGGDGLRLRYQPGLEGDVHLLGGEGEVFQVKDGPQEVSGHTWWYLVNPQDPRREGWAVADFLVLVLGP